MSPTYAVPADLAAPPWNLTVAEADALSLIARAGRLVRAATATAFYVADDSTGLPTDPDKANALRDAVCSQIETWTKLAADPALGAANSGTVIVAKSRGSASVQYSAYASTVLARARATTRISEDALMILAEEGLVGASPVLF